MSSSTCTEKQATARRQSAKRRRKQEPFSIPFPVNISREQLEQIKAKYPGDPYGMHVDCEAVREIVIKALLNRDAQKEEE